MGCSGCSTVGNGKPGGCQSNGGCATGGCNRMNTYDWLASYDIYEPEAYNVVEVSFKNGSRKSFYYNHDSNTITGDMVVVEAGGGYDIGRVSLSGDLVRLQMKKKRVSEESLAHSIIRRANERDLDRLHEAREKEFSTMFKARQISRTLDLEMKIGDVEYQGDKRKATFYYTADGRVDFRELIRHFAKEFKVKIEMRQIGARQESARIGGIGSCGRELCCSTWLTDFKSVSTTAARYQNLAINQTKLSGQCGRLKCCLNYELDSYMDALEHFPKNGERLQTQAGMANLVKTDIFKGLMYYIYTKKSEKSGKFYALPIDRVKEILALNKKGEFPLELMPTKTMEELLEEDLMDYEDVTGAIELPEEVRRKKRRKKRKPSNKGGKQGGGKSNTPKKDNTKKDDSRKDSNKPTRNKKPNSNRKPRPPKDANAKGKPENKANNKPENKGDNSPKPKSKSRNNRNRNRNRNRKPKDANGTPKDNKPRDNKPQGKTQKDNKPSDNKPKE